MIVIALLLTIQSVELPCTINDPKTIEQYCDLKGRLVCNTGICSPEFYWVKKAFPAVQPLPRIK